MKGKEYKKKKEREKKEGVYKVLYLFQSSLFFFGNCTLISLPQSHLLSLSLLRLYRYILRVYFIMSNRPVSL